ncbi:MAG: GatB/YqeY domain-containing protein [Candidatus Sungbacteria bacterium]|nr:GatB/YqeY domain-containing protein [Candidatus Sungbacteria bacterium]
MLKTDIENAARAAMKSQDAVLVGTLRMALAAIKNRELEKRAKSGAAELTEEETMAVVKSEVKKRKDSVMEFEKASRQDLADKEKAELAILEKYLPAEISDEEIEKLVRPLAAGRAVTDFGAVMGLAMKAIAGRASGDRVSAVVKQILTKQ